MLLQSLGYPDWPGIALKQGERAEGTANDGIQNM